MKKLTKILSLMLAGMMLATTIAACGGDDDEKTSESVDVSVSAPASEETSESSGTGELTDVTVDSRYAKYEIGAPLSEKTVGYGAQMDTDIFMPWNNMTEEDTALWEQRIKDMNLQYSRIKFFPEFFERANDNDDINTFDMNAAGVDFDTVEMQALYKLLDICEENHINVDLSWYGCYSFFKSYDGNYEGTWMGYTKEDLPNAWVTAPKRTANFDGYAEYAENISVGLDYLINTKKYTCIWGFSVIAEMFMDDTGAIRWENYAECCRIVHERLKKDGLRDKVVFIGTSNQSHHLKSDKFAQEQEMTKEYFDVYGSGCYNWENSSDLEGAEDYFEDYLSVCYKDGKPGYIVSEFCQGKHFINAVDKTDIDDYEAGLYIARFMIAAASKGVIAFNHYILGDTFFTNSYVHTMGLWMYRTEGWKAHPEYYFWGLICKYTDIGSEVYPIQRYEEDYDDIMLIAFRLPDGSWSYMIANNDTKVRKVAIVNKLADRPSEMNVYKVTEAGIPEDRAVVLPSAYTTLNASAGVAYVNVPAKGFVVVSDKK